MVRRPAWVSLVALLGLTLFSGIATGSAVAQVSRPVYVEWSDQTYGPDGPWQAVRVAIGAREQEISLYPGGSWESTILLEDICRNTTITSNCYAAIAGTFNERKSHTWDNSTIKLSPNGTGWNVWSLGEATAVPINALADRATDTINIAGISVPDVSLVGLIQAYQTYPDGRNYPLQVGVLSLGASEINQSFPNSGGPSTNGTFVTSWAYESGAIQSYSWGMHIGSAALHIPGSLYLGGFDANRVLGPVTSQRYFSGTLPIQLQDISIGVLKGGSPWSYPTKSGLLAQGNSSILSTGVQVLASPADPYIYLPQSACFALAAELPIVFQPQYGLFFWDTNDPQYAKVTTSPSYLGFTFDKDGVNNENITIKVPLSLLNLTLETPLVDQPTPYFPCMPTNGTYVLGRAFLQAAFVGFNWNKGNGNWFLAQAPGPGYSQTASLSLIEPDATTISGSTSSWENTWSGHWTPLPSHSANASIVEQPSPVHSGLSSGAKAGIGIGCAVGGILLIALAYWAFSTICRARSSSVPSLAQGEYVTEEKIVFQGGTPSEMSSSAAHSVYYGPREIGTGPTDPSLHGTVFELPAYRGSQGLSR